MKKFKCILLRSQYQTVEVETENYEQAKEAWVLFDIDKVDQTYIEVYDLTEVEPTREQIKEALIPLMLKPINQGEVK